MQNQAFFPLNGNERWLYKPESAHNRLQATVLFAEKTESHTFV